MSPLIPAIIGGFIGGGFSLFVYYYNLKKESFFKLQEKAENLLNYLYEYQDIIGIVDLSKDMVQIEAEIVEGKEDIENYYKLGEKYSILCTNKQKIRDKIWTLISLYFPFLEKDFRSYTMTEINYNPNLEFNPNTVSMRERRISEIGEKLINYINLKRRVFLFLKL